MLLGLILIGKMCREQNVTSKCWQTICLTFQVYFRIHCYTLTNNIFLVSTETVFFLNDNDGETLQKPPFDFAQTVCAKLFYITP